MLAYHVSQNMTVEVMGQELLDLISEPQKGREQDLCF